MRKRLMRMGGLLLALALAIGLARPAFAAARQEGVTIRVGFPIQKGLTQIDEQGVLSGYTYEYLQEIAQYTGWNYEFVRLEGTADEQLIQMMDMLEKGELDLMGGMVLNDDLAQIYDYPGYNYGMAYTTLLVLDENTAINESNYQTFHEIRVAVPATATRRIQILEQFCQANDITAKLVYFDWQEDGIELLRAGEADALLEVDLNTPDDMRPIAKFSPQPYYFAVTKQRTDLINKLNFAIVKINEADPYFATTLYEKYFNPKQDKLLFSDEEQQYLDTVGALRVAYLRREAPLQYQDDQTGEIQGVAKGVLDYVSRKTGLVFEYVPADNEEDFNRLLQGGQVDLGLGISYDYEEAQRLGVSLTRPFLTSQVTMVLRPTVDANALEGKTLVLPKGKVNNHVPAENILWLDTMEACLEALRSGQADYSYGNGYLVQYYVNQPRFHGLQSIAQSSSVEKTCVGVVKPANVNLLTILNKAVGSMPETELQAMLYQSTQDTSARVTLRSFVESNPIQALLSLMAIAMLFIGTLLWILISRTRSNRRIALDNKRYHELSELANEGVFEYDFRRDRLHISSHLQQLLGGELEKEQFQARLDREAQAAILGLMARLGDQGEMDEELEIPLEKGQSRWVRVVARILKGSNGRPAYAVGKVVDIHQERVEHERLLQQAQRDGLTGLYNAVTARRLIGESLQVDSSGRGALFIVDVDHFKTVNDIYGHSAGDEVLKQMARSLRAIFRSDDILGRMGGDEFVVFLKGVSNGEIVTEKCDMLLRQMEEMSKVEPGLTITLSVGVAMVREGQTCEELYQQADLALYAVKKRGRNGFEIV